MELTKQGSFSLTPKSLDEAMRFADALSKSTIVPKDFASNPGNILVAIQWGMELGLQPMQAMQNIAVINGRPSLWGDAVIGIVRGSPLCEYIYEDDDGETATCRVKRRGEKEQVRTFSMADANAAGLTNKPGPWKQYPKRMRQMRARAFALRDVFPDVLRGMPIAEEVMDIPTERDITPNVPQIVEQAEVILPPYSDEDLAENTEAWREAIGTGRASAEALIARISSKYTLSDEQRGQIFDLELEVIQSENA